MWGTKTCKNCSGEYEQKHIKQEYCSRRCGRSFRNKMYYTTNPEKVLEKRIKENSNVPNRIFLRVRSRARVSGIPFEISIEDIIIPEFCPVLGIKLNVNVNKGSGYHDDSPSLDKIKPELGYIKGNVRVISNRANLLKNNSSSKELQLIVDDLRELGL